MPNKALKRTVLPLAGLPLSWGVSSQMPKYQALALHERVEANIGALESRAFLTRPEHKRLREMWCASRLLTGYSGIYAAAEVAIEDVDEQREYDFYLVIENEWLPFQIVEVLDAGRRRGDEYREMSRAQVEKHHRNRGLEGVEYGMTRVREELQKKIDKNYANADQLHILLYLNVNVAGFEWGALRDASAQATTTFSSIWAVTQDIFCCVYGGDRWNDQEAWRPIES